MPNIKEYREMEVTGLGKKLEEVEAEYFDLKFQSSLSKLENVCLIRQKRRDIARIKTIMSEKQQEKVK